MSASAATTSPAMPTHVALPSAITATAAAPDAAHAPAAATHGVLIVHGIGNQRQSDILLDIGEPLHDWLSRWHRARGEAPPDLRRVVLNFDPVERGAADGHAFAALDLPSGDRWVLAEAWWAASVRRQSFVEMLRWTGRHLIEAARSLVFGAWERLIGEGTDPAMPGMPLGDGRDPAAGKGSPTWRARRYRIMLAIYYQTMLVLFFLALFIGTPFLLLILALAQIPFSPLRNALYGLVGPFLEVNLGEFRTIFEDEIQSANMRRRIADAVGALVREHGCADVTIVAHSGGAVVSFDMLADPRHAVAARRVRKLITVGSGLNKAWLIAPELRRLHGPLPEHIHWVDIWGTLDPAPSGPVQPPPDPARPDHNIAVFQPGPAVIATQHLTARRAASTVAEGRTRRQDGANYWPESVRCTNELSVITDHWVYWQNDEEALARIVAEIDRPYYRDSPFWRGDHPPGSDGPGEEPAPLESVAEAPQRRGIQRRRERVIRLTAARLFALVGWAFAAGLLAGPLACWLYDRRNSALPLPSSLVGLLVTLDGWAATALGWLAPAGRWLVGLFPPFTDRTFTLLDRPFGSDCFTITIRLFADGRLPLALLIALIAGLMVIPLLVANTRLTALPEGSARRQRWKRRAPLAFARVSAVAIVGPWLALFLPLLAPRPVFWTIAALLLGLPVLALFNRYRNQWGHEDARARKAFIAALATNRA